MWLGWVIGVVLFVFFISFVITKKQDKEDARRKSEEEETQRLKKQREYEIVCSPEMDIVRQIATLPPSRWQFIKSINNRDGAGIYQVELFRATSDSARTIELHDYQYIQITSSDPLDRSMLGDTWRELTVDGVVIPRCMGAMERLRGEIAINAQKSRRATPDELREISRNL
ncbi:MAG: hypothetical protein WCJ56_00430 [bacterium]